MISISDCCSESTSCDVITLYLVEQLPSSLVSCDTDQQCDSAGSTTAETAARPQTVSPVTKLKDPSSAINSRTERSKILVLYGDRCDLLFFVKGIY